MNSDKFKGLGETVDVALQTELEDQSHGHTVDEVLQAEEYYRTHRPDLDVTTVASRPTDMKGPSRGPTIIFKLKREG